MCKECITNSATYITSCLGCMARFTLTLNKPLRLWQIENNGKHDIDLLKQEVLKRAK